MKTILITGSDTGIGKTWVVGVLASQLAATGGSVQIVKPVECGYTDVENSDADVARRFSGSDGVSAHTLHCYKEAIAPVAAALAEGVELRLNDLVSATSTLPVADWRLIEGAGGIAVPLEKGGSDWANFAKNLPVDGIVVVVENRLGSINQSRLTCSYARNAGVPVGLWLNTTKELEDSVRESNRSGILESGISIVGETELNASCPYFINTDWFNAL